MGEPGPTLRMGTVPRCSHRCPSCGLAGVALRCRVCGSDLPNEATEETWLEVPLGSGWLAAYRLAADEGGSPVVAEVRVFPDEPGRRHPGRWSAERLGSQAPVPHGGLPARVLRRLKVREHLANLEPIVACHGDRQSFRLELLDHGFSQVAREAGTRRRSDRFYAELAAEYVNLVAAGARNPVQELRRQLESKGLHFAEATIRDFIHEARRKRGLLTANPPGRAGGALTPKAHAALARKEDDELELTKAKTWVHMQHPETGGRSRVTRRAFERVWSAKGWQLVEDDTEEES